MYATSSSLIHSWSKANDTVHWDVNCGLGPGLQLPQGCHLIP